MSRVLIIVVTYNGMRWIDKCLSSVAASGADAFVFDNNSSDGTADYVSEHYPSMHLVRSESNLGFAGGNNAGFLYALQNGYDAVYLLNQDAWIFPETIPSLLGLMDANPSFGILSPMQMQADGVSYNKAFGRDVLTNPPPAFAALEKAPVTQTQVVDIAGIDAAVRALF